MRTRIAIIQGHPDPAGGHLLHAMTDAYAQGAAAAGHEVRRTEVAKLEFPLLPTQGDFETGTIPPNLMQAREETMSALFKGFLEHIFRPGFAMEYKAQGFHAKVETQATNEPPSAFFPKRLLVGHSARVVVTMGMPVLFYRWYFGAYGLRGFERSMLSSAGIKPIRESLYGLTFADDKKRARWIEDMRRHGERGD
jgi:putative NADPH-quinone reductase